MRIADTHHHVVQPHDSRNVREAMKSDTVTPSPTRPRLRPDSNRTPQCWKFPWRSPVSLRSVRPQDDPEQLVRRRNTKFCIRTLPITAPDISFNYEYLLNTSDWYGRWRLASNSTNDFRIDREIQRTESYTGIEGLEIQDVCITESMGPITDHASEHLVPSDIMVARTRRRLLRAAIALRDSGAIPTGVDTPAAYARAWGGFINAEKGVSFDEVYRPGQRRCPRAKRTV